MPLELKGVHQYEKVPNSQEARLVKVNPYLRLTHQGHPPVYVQGGAIYAEGGGPVSPVPDWFDEEMRRVNPKVRDEVGWKPLPGDPPLLSGPQYTGGSAAYAAGNPVTVNMTTAPAAMPTTWTCPAAGCGETMPTRKKGLHVAKHRRAERA